MVYFLIFMLLHSFLIILFILHCFSTLIMDPIPTCAFQITEELEKVKQEMDERGSSMTDGGELSYNHFSSLSWYKNINQNQI